MKNFLKLKNDLLSKPYLSSYDMEDLNKFIQLLNKVLIDYNYQLDFYDYFILGVRYYFRKDWTTSLIYAEKTIELAPDYPRAYNLKALILRELKRYNQALEFIEKAIELNPDYKFLAMDDKDFDNIRNEEEFKNLIK